MHELGLCESFMDAVLRRADDRKVAGVRVRIGVLHRVEEEAFQQAFGFVTQGTVAEGASVELVTTPALIACEACAVQTESAEMLAVCPACGAASLRIVGGQELVLESIRLAVGPPRPAPVEEAVPAEPDDGHTHDAAGVSWPRQGGPHGAVPTGGG